MQKILEEDQQQSKKDTGMFTVDKKRKYHGKVFEKQKNKTWEYVVSVQQMANEPHRYFPY